MNLKLSIQQLSATNGINENQMIFSASLLDKHIVLNQQQKEIEFSLEIIEEIMKADDSILKTAQYSQNSVITHLYNQNLYIDLIQLQTMPGKKKGEEEQTYLPHESQSIDLQTLFSNTSDSIYKTDIQLVFTIDESKINLSISLEFEYFFKIENKCSINFMGFNLQNVVGCNYSCYLKINEDIIQFQQFINNLIEQEQISNFKGFIDIQAVQHFSQLNNDLPYSKFISHAQLSSYTAKAIEQIAFGTSEIFELFYLLNRPVNQNKIILNLNQNKNFTQFSCVVYPQFQLLKKVEALSTTEFSKVKQCKDSPIDIQTIGQVTGNKYFGFQRSQLYQTSATDAPYEQDLLEYAVIVNISGQEMNDSSKKDYQIKQVNFPVPLDLHLHSELLGIKNINQSQIEISKPQKGKQPDATYSNNDINYTMKNKVIGINYLIDKLQKIQVNSLTQINSTNDFIKQIMLKYNENLENLDQVYETLYQLQKLQFIQILSNNQSPQTPKILFTLQSNEPICLIRNPNFQTIKQSLSLPPQNTCLSPKPLTLTPSNQLKNNMIALLQNLTDRYILAQKPEQASLQNLTTQQAREIDQLMKTKQLSLRGIQGKFTQQTIKTQKQQVETLSLYEFSQIVQGEGFLEQIIRIVEPQILDLARGGFSGIKQLVTEIQTLLEQEINKIQISVNQKAINNTPKLQELQVKSPQILGQIASPRLEQAIIRQEKQNITSNITTQLCQILQLLTTYDFNYIQASFKQLLAILSKNKVEDFLISDFRVFIQLLICSGLLISQPHETSNLEDQNRIKSYLKSPISLVLTLIEKVEYCSYLPNSACILTLSWIKTERFIAVLADEKDKLVAGGEKLNYNEEKPLTATMTTSSQKEKRLGEYVQLKVQDTWFQVSENSTLKLIQRIVEDDEDFSLNIIYNGLMLKDNNWKSSDTKADIITNLQRYVYCQQDISSMLENMGFPEFQMTQKGRFNMIAYSDLIIYNDESGKKRQMTVEESETKEIDLKLNETGVWIIMSFLYLMWKKNLITIKQVDEAIQNAVSRVFQKYQMQFRGVLQDLIDKQEQERFATSGQSSYRAATASVNNIKQQPSYVNLLPKVQTTLQGLDTKKQMEKHATYNQLIAIQEHICHQVPQISHVLPTRKQFDSDENYMNYMLQVCSPSHQDNNMDKFDQQIFQQTTALVNLGEWLCIRGEQILSKMAYEEAQVQVAKIKTEFSSLQTINQRIHLILIRQLYYSKNYNAVIEYTDLIRQQGGILYQKMKNSPQYNLIRSRAFLECYMMKRNGQNVKIYNTFIDTQTILDEINKNTFQAYYAQNKSKGEFDDFYKGSTNIGDVGFFDNSFGYGLMTCFISSINLLNHVKQLYLPPEQLNTRKYAKEEQPQTSTAFLQDLKLGDRNSQETLINMINSGEFDVLDSVQQSARTDLTTQATTKKIALKNPKNYQKLLKAADFEAMKEQMIEQSKEGQTRDSPMTRQQSLLSKQQHLVSQHMHVKEDADTTSDELKETYKQIQSATMACKQFLDNFSGFGPAWGLYSILQLSMGNISEARMSSSLSTLMCPQVPETWIAWVICELFNGISNGGNYDVIMSVYRQIGAMGVQESKSIDFWDEVVKLVENEKK